MRLATYLPPLAWWIGQWRGRRVLDLGRELEVLSGPFDWIAALGLAYGLLARLRSHETSWRMWPPFSMQGLPIR